MRDEGRGTTEKLKNTEVKNRARRALRRKLIRLQAMYESGRRKEEERKGEGTTASHKND